MWTMRQRLVVSCLVVLALVAAGCGNAKAVVSKGGNTDGVTAHSILVGGIASVTGPLPGAFAPVFQGVSAYFDMVNAAGGIDGRRIDYPSSDQLDDESDPSIDVLQARALVQADHVFAVVGVATPSFSGAAYLAENDVPTFGYNVNPQWSDGPSLFGYDGSFTDFEHPGYESAFVAEQVHAKRVGIIAYNLSQSRQACQGIENTMARFHVPVKFTDFSVTPPASVAGLSADVERMRTAGVDFVASCLDLAGNLVLSSSLKAAGMTSATQYWLDGYDESALQRSAALMDGVYLLVSHVPFESGISQPSRYPEMALYLKEMHRYFPTEQPSEPSLAGWVSAEMFVTGLRMVGRDLTRSRLVAAINSLTSFTGGLMAPIDWRLEHTSVGLLDCNVFVRVEGSRFVPVFGSPPTVFKCLAYPQPSSYKVVVVKPPAAIPGG